MEGLRICEECRQPLPQDAPEGLCPTCLAKVALGTEPAGKPTAKTKSAEPASTITVWPLTQGESAEPASTLTVNPAAGLRVRYFGDYELQEEIARGGMGVVWKARQSSLNRTVALKMILAGKLASETEVQRFRREAEAAANLQHPNIVAIHEVGEHDGQHYYTMDYVAGRDLGAMVRESGPLPPARAAECVKTLAEAVHFAHQRGTLHRDLKPQNVLIDAAGVPRITDFGLAKFVERDESLTQTGAAMGSPSYMPPEQAAGHLDEVGPHSDVYSLGAILYELLTGRPPFRAESAMATMRQVMESEPVAPRKLNATLPPDLETICLKCLEKNPARRYASARALAEELGRFLNHEPIQALPVSAIRKAESWLRRHPWTLMAAGWFVVMVLMGLLYWQFQRVKFLQNHPLVNGQAPRHPGLRMHQLSYTWDEAMAVVQLAMILPLLFFVMNVRRKTTLKLFGQLTLWDPARPLSQRLRVVCGLMSVAAVGFTVLYLAKLIQVSVWESTPRITEWCSVYLGSYMGLMLLFLVVQDYQKFVHGMPGMPCRTLTPEQSEPLRQAIFDGHVPRALKLYRRTIPEASWAEARNYVDKLVAELKATHPEKLAPPIKPWDLNWRLMGACLVVEFGVLAGVWMVIPLEAPGTRLLAAAAGFLLGTGAFFSLRLKAHWRGAAWALCLVLAGYAMTQFSQLAFAGGLVFGALMILSGFTPKRRKSAPITTHVEP
jgi:tRNA A-37 threonylcarbamoyl transferase component Bud32